MILLNLHPIEFGANGAPPTYYFRLDGAPQRYAPEMPLSAAGMATKRGATVSTERFIKNRLTGDSFYPLGSARSISVESDIKSPCSEWYRGQCLRGERLNCGQTAL